MIALLLLAAAPAMTPVDAERAFAADAQKIGQWTAFRKWAAPDAIFLPPEKVLDALKDAKDPPKAVDWWPTASFLSCDNKVGANTGGAIWPSGRATYFSTIWVKQADGNWRYALDAGEDQPTARPRPAKGGPVIRRASCKGKPVGQPMIAPADIKWGGGGSPDRTLIWNWAVRPDGARSFDVQLWMGDRYEKVIDDRVAAPPPKPKTP